MAENEWEDVHKKKSGGAGTATADGEWEDVPAESAATPGAPPKEEPSTWEKMRAATQLTPHERASMQPWKPEAWTPEGQLSSVKGMAKEVGGGLMNIAEMPAGILHAFTDKPQTEVEKTMAAMPGPTGLPNIPQIGIGAKRLLFGNQGEEAIAAAQRGHWQDVPRHVAGMTPLVGPWIENLSEKVYPEQQRVERGEEPNPLGGITEGLTEFGGGELAGRMGPEIAKKGIEAGKEVAKVPAVLADKMIRGTPITEAGKIEAAKQQALTVKKPSMTETEYEQKVTNAIPDLQRIAQNNKGNIKTPRQAVAAINGRIAQMEAPIAEHIKGLNAPEDMIHPDQFHTAISKAVDRELAKHPGQLTAAEIEKAKTKVMEFIGDQPKSLEEVEGNRKRLNTDSEDYYKSRPADKRVMDASDATAIAQKAAANQFRNLLYGEEGKPGFLENAGVTVVDQEGNPVSLREHRQKVGNLLEVRDHFEDAMTKAEAAGDWKAFDPLHKGPSFAAGGAGLVAGAAAGGPIGALFGTIAGEGAKVWADYLRTKNPNLNVEKMFRNLGETAAPNVSEVKTAAPIHQYEHAAGPRIPQFMEPIGPQPEPPPFAVSGAQPGLGAGTWTPQAGELPPIGFGEQPAPAPPAPMAAPAPTAPPQVAPEFRTERIGQPGAELPATGPVNPNALGLEGLGGIRIPEGSRMLPAPAAAPVPPPAAPGMLGEIGGPGREGVLSRIGEKAAEEPSVWESLSKEVKNAIKKESAGPVKKSGMEDLKVGDTFVDAHGEPRRIVEIKDGKIETADGTERTYEDDVEHLGEINSARAQLARGGKLIPGPEGGLGEIKSPRFAYRAQDVGGTEMNPESHAHATESLEEAEKYKEGRETVRGVPQEVVRVDLEKMKPEDYKTLEGPNGKKWFKFNRQPESNELQTLEPNELQARGFLERQR